MDTIVRTRGNVRQPVDFEVVRELTEDDLALLAEARGSKPKPLTKRLSERHHALARFLASGMPNWEAAAVTGYTAHRISILQADPTFKELVAFYRANVESKYADLHDRLAGMAVDAADILRDRMEDNPDELGDGTLLEVVKMGADRTGHGPSSTNVQVNVGLAGRLEAARKRVALIDVTPERKDEAA